MMRGSVLSMAIVALAQAPPVSLAGQGITSY